MWKALLGILRGDSARATEHARRAWERLPASHADALGLAGCFLAIALQMSGQPEAVQRLLHSNRVAELEGHPAARTRFLYGPVLGQFASASFRSVESLAREFLQTALQTGHEIHIAWAEYFLGRVYYEWNDLDAALEHYTAVLERRDRAHFYTVQASRAGAGANLPGAGPGG